MQSHLQHPAPLNLPPPRAGARGRFAVRRGWGQRGALGRAGLFCCWSQRCARTLCLASAGGGCSRSPPPPPPRPREEGRAPCQARAGSHPCLVPVPVPALPGHPPRSPACVSPWVRSSAGALARCHRVPKGLFCWISDPVSD